LRNGAIEIRSTLVLLATLVAAIGIIVGAQASASYAHDHLVPETVLKKGGRELQKGLRVIEYSWTRPSGGGTCVKLDAILTTRFRDADTVAPGSGLRIRILKTQRPTSFDVVAWKRVDEDGIPSGEAHALPVSLKPVVQNGQRVAWDAIFRVNRPGRHYYLISEGHWSDTEGCGGVDQFAHWSFHVETAGS
jgi:hypothetical protein